MKSLVVATEISRIFTYNELIRFEAAIYSKHLERIKNPCPIFAHLKLNIQQMKNLIPFCVLVLTTLMMGCDKEVSVAKMDNFQDSLSYSIGVQVAEMIKQQGDEVNAEVVAMALREALRDSAQLTLEQCQTIMQMSAMKKAEAAGSEGRAFLEENAKKDGVKVTASGLQYRMITEGPGESPTIEDRVTVHYKLTLMDGSVADSSYGGQPYTTSLTQVIRGWTEGLQLMKVGGKMELTVPSELGYGSRGSGRIPGGAVLIFEMELMSIEE